MQCPYLSKYGLEGIHMQLGVRDVARILNVSEKSIYRWIQQGQLPA